MTNAERFKHHLQISRLSLNDVARKLGIDKFSVWRYTSAKRYPEKRIQKLMERKLNFYWEVSK